ncbi:hypothetical protein VE00_03456 [Pseudogymnoascus sp. WSF 3629]|nr:hypothetical protein VE00_03456 [Pseudogymnoascus sp. WSF 3629]
MAAETRSSVYLTLIIFRGEPDWIKRRHVGFDLPTKFAIDLRPNYDPFDSSRFAKSVAVGYLNAHVTKLELQNLIYNNAQPDNLSWEENCQIWAGRVLEILRDQGYLGSAEVAAAIDGMAGAVAEATEEDQAE